MVVGELNHRACWAGGFFVGPMDGAACRADAARFAR
jgi:hypothetical protein